MMMGSKHPSGRDDLSFDKLYAYYKAVMPEEEAKERAEQEIEWWHGVWDRCGGTCGCGETKRLRAQMIHPPYLGGEMIPANGTLLCMKCYEQRERGISKYVEEQWGEKTSRLNVAIPRRLHDKIKDLASHQRRTVTSVIMELLTAWAGVHDSRPAVEAMIMGSKR